MTTQSDMLQQDETQQTSIQTPVFWNQQDWLATSPPDSDQLVQLSWRDKTTFFEAIYQDMGIAEAAEHAVAFYLSQQDKFPEGLIYATVYWANGAIWGPFPVDVSITVEATCLRGGE